MKDKTPLIMVMSCFVPVAFAFVAPPVQASKRHVVEVSGFEFRPARLTAAVGDTIVWVNRDVVPHTTTSDGTEWDSRSIDTDGTWSLRISGAGKMSYFCSYHPKMTGVIIVP